MYLFINIIGDILIQQNFANALRLHCLINKNAFYIFTIHSDKALYLIIIFIDIDGCLQPPKIIELPDWLSSVFVFQKITLKCLTANPLSQIVTANPRLQPDTHFAVDMSPHKKAELFQKSGFKSKLPKKPGNMPLFSLYLSFLDSKQTVSTWHDSS